MARVVAIPGAQTITIEENGVRRDVTLRGIEINDDRGATDLLRWTLDGSWVLVEDGLVYRSPDGMLVNRELVTRGFARAVSLDVMPPTHVATVYLGELDLGARAASTQSSSVRQTPRATGTGKTVGTPRRLPRPRARTVGRTANTRGN